MQAALENFITWCTYKNLNIHINQCRIYIQDTIKKTAFNISSCIYHYENVYLLRANSIILFIFLYFELVDFRRGFDFLLLSRWEVEQESHGSLTETPWRLFKLHHTQPRCSMLSRTSNDAQSNVSSTWPRGKGGLCEHFRTKNYTIRFFFFFFFFFFCQRKHSPSTVICTRAC